MGGHTNTKGVIEFHKNLNIMFALYRIAELSGTEVDIDRPCHLLLVSFVII